MRTRIRRALGITDAEGEVTSAEAVAIFTICYVQFYTVTTPGDVRRPRIMHDHHDFIDPRKPDGLPYYVMAIHDLGQVPEGLPSAFVEAYVDSTELHTLQDAPGYDAMAAAQAEKLYALMRRPRPKQ
ncbi:MAG: hypothetical protein JO019_02485 [Candidatus Kaiserbacteria bacterium]|nr:hypothetical protein [Candidatus Kaiserbacteria bacterium]